MKNVITALLLLATVIVCYVGTAKADTFDLETCDPYTGGQC